MGKGIGWRKSLLFLWFLVFDTFCLPAFSQSNDWDVTILDRLLASVKHGQALVQVGDMFVTVSNLRAWRNQLAGAPMPLSAFDGAIPTWTSGTVYYTFSNNVSVEHQQVFFDGMQEWATFANLQFIARTTQSNYVTIVDGGTSQEGGDSALGMVGGQQFIHIGGTSWNRGTICHELGHTLGLIHEHQCSDRDSFVTILTNNIITGLEANFVKLTNSRNKTAYDFLSIMHYSRNTFSTDPAHLDTIEPLPAYYQYLNLIGNSDPVLSALDRAGMALVYGVGPTLSAVVTNTHDSGAGRLRAAIYYAFDHPGTTITLNIPTTDPGFSGSVFTINPTDRFPNLVNQMIIDGTAEPTNTNPNGPEIVLNGSLAAQPDVFANGLHITGSNCPVRGLVISGFNGSGLAIEGSSAVGNIVSGCYIGTDPTGAPRGSATSSAVC